MIEHIWTVVCSMSVIDRETNNLSLFNIIEQLNILAQPQSDMTLQLTLNVVTLWGRVDYAIPAQGSSRITFLSPLGEAIGQVEGEIDLSKHERLRMFRRFPLGLNLKDSGRYCFRIELRMKDEEHWLTVANVPLQVVVDISPGEV